MSGKFKATERRGLQDCSFREGEAAFRSLIESSPDVFAVSHLDGRLEYVSPAVEAVLGYQPAELIGRTAYDFTHPEEIAAIAEQMARLSGNSPSLPLIRYRFRHKDGSWRELESRGIAHRVDGPVVRILTISRDVTDLSEAEERFRRVVENINDALIIGDVAGKVTFANERFIELLGVERERVGSITLEDYVAPEYREQLREQHDRRVRGEAVQNHLEYQGIRGDGRKIWLEMDVTPIKNDKGEVTGTQSAIRDITARKQAEQELRRSSRRFSLLAWTSNQLLLVREPAATLRQLSQQAMKEMGCDLFLSYLAEDSLHLDSYFGLPEDLARAVNTLEYGKAVCGIVAEKRQAIVIECVQENRMPEADIIRSWGLRAFACYPLAYRDRIVGTLAFGTFSRDRFNPDDLALMESFSNQVAIAMGRRQVEEELWAMHAREHEHAAELERRVEERTDELRRAHEEIVKRTKTLESLTRELTETENRERRRMAELLHDGLQQIVVAAQMSVKSLQSKVTGDEKLEIDRLDLLLAEALQASRSLTYDLCPPVLSTPGLAAALVWLAGQMREKHALNVEVSIREDVEPREESAKIVLFNGVRELLFNVVKHAGTYEARIDLSPEGDDLLIRVSDCGMGFDMTGLALDPSKGGFGLFSIRERIGVFGGTLKIDSKPGSGTVARLVAPRKRGRDEKSPVGKKGGSAPA